MISEVVSIDGGGLCKTERSTGIFELMPYHSQIPPLQCLPRAVRAVTLEIVRRRPVASPQERNTMAARMVSVRARNIIPPNRYTVVRFADVIGDIF
jgi:hypothetical protein